MDAQPQGRSRMAAPHLEANPWIRREWLASSKRLAEQDSIPFSRCGRTDAQFNKVKAGFTSSWQECNIMKINRFAWFTASLRWTEGGTRCLSEPLDSWLIWTHARICQIFRKKIYFRGISHPNVKKFLQARLIRRWHFFDQSLTAIRELRRLICPPSCHFDIIRKEQHSTSFMIVVHDVSAPARVKMTLGLLNRRSNSN